MKTSEKAWSSGSRSINFRKVSFWSWRRFCMRTSWN